MYAYFVCSTSDLWHLQTLRTVLELLRRVRENTLASLTGTCEQTFPGSPHGFLSSFSTLKSSILRRDFRMPTSGSGDVIAGSFVPTGVGAPLKSCITRTCPSSGLCVYEEWQCNYERIRIDQKSRHFSSWRCLWAHENATNGGS